MTFIQYCSFFYKHQTLEVPHLTPRQSAVWVPYPVKDQISSADAHTWPTASPHCIQGSFT